MPGYYCANCGKESGMMGHYGKRDGVWGFSCTKPSPEEYERNVEHSKQWIAASYGQTVKEYWGDDE